MIDMILKYINFYLCKLITKLRYGNAIQIADCLWAKVARQERVC